MSRRLPRCAICGGSLRFPDGCKFRMVLTFTDRLYQPSVGWCDKHPGPIDEAIWMMAKERTRDELTTKLLEIFERGPGRRVDL